VLRVVVVVPFAKNIPKKDLLVYQKVGKNQNEPIFILR
jgi:hypothetical protein